MPIPVNPPFGQMTICNMGQSVGRGLNSTPTRTTTFPYNCGVVNDTSVTRANTTAYGLGVFMCLVVPNGMYKCTTAGTSAGAPPIFDNVIGHTTNDGMCVWTCVSPSNGNWDNTQPDSPSLTRIQANMPVHRAGGEDHATACCASLAQRAMAAIPRYGHWTTNTSCVAIDAASITVIKKGGSGPAYQNAMMEIQALHDMNSGVTHGCVVMLTHGETDANSLTYLADVWNGIGSPIQTDIPAINGGQATPIYFLVNQQSSYPQAASQAGVTLSNQGGTNESALAQLQGCTTHTGIWIGTCSKYFLPYYTDHVHLTPFGEDWLGDYETAAIWSIYVNSVIPQPLAPSSIVAAAGTNTIVINYGGTFVSPLVWDTTFTAPHQTGSMAAWANGKGWEVTELPTAITGCVDNGSGFYRITATAHPFSTNDNIQIYNLNGNPTANCTALITKIDANTFDIQGVGFLGTYVSGGTASRVVSITSAVLTGAAQVTLTLGRNISTGGCVSYAFSPDTTSPGGFGSSRGGLLRDSSTAIGEMSGMPMNAWAWISRNAGIT